MQRMGYGAYYYFFVTTSELLYITNPQHYRASAFKYWGRGGGFIGILLALRVLWPEGSEEGEHQRGMEWIKAAAQQKRESEVKDRQPETAREAQEKGKDREPAALEKQTLALRRRNESYRRRGKKGICENKKREKWESHGRPQPSQP